MLSKRISLAAIAVAIVIPAGAQSIADGSYGYDNTSPFSSNSYHFSNSWVVDAPDGNWAVTFNDPLMRSGGTTYAIDPVGLYQTSVIRGDGSSVSVYDFCTELFVGLDTEASYSVTSGFGSLDTTKQANLSTFLSNALPSFIASPNDISAAAMQIGIWEIIEDSNLTLGSGDLSVDSSFAGDATSAVGLAETWLTSVRTNAWTDQGGLAFYYADGDSQQSRLWVEVVPEPSTALLGLLGFGLLARRRR